MSNVSVNCIKPLERGEAPLLILNYHAVIDQPLAIPDWCFLDARLFREQLACLQRYFDVSPLHEALTALKGSSLTRPTVAITFDDGFQNNYDVAYPILREAGVPATIFLVTEFVDTDRTLWFCELLDAFGKTTLTELEWNENTYELTPPRKKMRASMKIQQRLKDYTPVRMREELDSLVRKLGGQPDAPVAPDSPYRILSSAALSDMAQSGLIDFGAHTHAHCILSKLSLQEQRSEIAFSLDATQRYTGKECRLFAYPNGRPEDFDDNSRKLLAELGVYAALTTAEGVNFPEADLFELKRLGIGADWTLAEFEEVIKGYAHTADTLMQDLPHAP